jgi:DNA repair protein REV1
MLARLATRRAKPAGSFHLLPSAFQNLLQDLDIQDLHGFGRAARDKANEKLGTTNLGELAGRSKGALCDALGNAMGDTLYNSIRGIDDRKLESDKPRKSVSCDINVSAGVRQLLLIFDRQELTYTHTRSTAFDLRMRSR